MLFLFVREGSGEGELFEFDGIFEHCCVCVKNTLKFRDDQNLYQQKLIDTKSDYNKEVISAQTKYKEAIEDYNSQVKRFQKFHLHHLP